MERLRIYSIARIPAYLIFLFCLGCIAPLGRTTTDEAYTQRYSTGSAPARGMAVHGHADALTAAIVALPALCQAIEQSRSTHERTARCNDLFRYLSNGNAAAYEWQSYYARCRAIQ